MMSINIPTLLWLRKETHHDYPSGWHTKAHIALLRQKKSHILKKLMVCQTQTTANKFKPPSFVTARDPSRAQHSKQSPTGHFLDASSATLRTTDRLPAVSHSLLRIQVSDLYYSAPFTLSET